MRIAVALLFILLLSFQARATTIRVPQDQSTIQAGINVAVDGDTVLVASGTYQEHVTIQNKGIVLTSAGGRDSTTIMPALASSPGVSYTLCRQRINTFEGFTITNWRTAASLYAESCYVVIEGNRFTGGIHSGNGTIELLWGDFVVRDNVFDNNQVSDQGGAIMLKSQDSSLIEGNLFVDNHAVYGGGASVWGSNVVIRRNLFVSNTAQYIGGAIMLEYSDNCMVYNNTIDSCKALYSQPLGGGISFYLSSNGNLFNNIITNCVGYGIWQLNSSGYLVDYNNCVLNSPSSYLGVSPGSGSLSADPHFVGGFPFDYHLQHTSPCINAGNPDPIYNDPDGTRNDMGAFAHNLIGVPSAVLINFGLTATAPYVFSLSPTLYWSYFDTLSTNQSGYEIEVGIDTNWAVAEMWSSGTVMSQDTSTAYGGAPLSDYTEYFLRMRVYNGSSWGGWSSFYFITHAQRLIMVPSFRPTIQDGVNFSIDGDTIVVSPGIYPEHLDFGGKQILLKSDKGPDSTRITKLLDGFDQVTFGAGCTENSTIEGFSIENSNSQQCIYVKTNSGATIRGNKIINITGIGINCLSRAAISGNSIIDCGIGVKLYQSSNSHVDDNHFSECLAQVVWIISSSNVNVSGNILTQNGGGLTLDAASNSLVNSNLIAQNGEGIVSVNSNYVTISGNTLIQNSASGGILMVLGSTNTNVVNNTLMKNTSSYGAIYSEGSTGCEVRNNIVALNTSWGIRVPVSNCCLTASYNDVFSNSSGNYFGVVPGPGSLSVDPRFCDVENGDASLASDSPCIGAGDGGVTMGSLGIGCALPVAEQPQVANIGIGEYEDSLHITAHNPLISWKYFDPQSRPLTKSELEVGSDNEWTIAEMWQPLTINSSDTAITYAGLPLTDGTTYFARVRVHNDTIWGNWRTLAFRLNTPPVLPEPYLPSNGTVVATGRPTLRVTNATDAEGDVLDYDFQVFSDSLLTSMVTFAAGINQGSGQTGWKTDSLQNENARHWWRSRASDGYETGNWCQPWSFVINAFNEPPATFGLLLPANGANGQSLLPSFTWSAAADPDPLDSVTYTLAIAIDSNFSFQSLTTGIIGTSHTLTENLNISTLYWWKVKAIDKLGSETWSSTKFRFRTITLGDADGSGVVTISDVVFLINYIFSGGPAPNPLSSGDADCSGAISISDAVYLIQYIFSGGPMPCEG